MSEYKIIITGPVGAGIKTAIQTMSDVPSVKTDVTANDVTKDGKSRAAVAMDYGVMNLEDGEKIHLYGMPGQGRFDFIWNILTAGGLGLIILLDNTRLDPFQDMRFFLDSFAGFISDTSVAIGVAQMNMNSKPSIKDYHKYLKKRDLKPAVFTVDATKQNDMVLLVKALVFTLDLGVEDE